MPRRVKQKAGKSTQQPTHHFQERSEAETQARRRTWERLSQEGGDKGSARRKIEAEKARPARKEQPPAVGSASPKSATIRKAKARAGKGAR